MRISFLVKVCGDVGRKILAFPAFSNMFCGTWSIFLLFSAGRQKIHGTDDPRFPSSFLPSST